MNANAPNLTWTTNFGDVTVGPFEQDSGPNLPENFDVSAATPLNYFELLFKPEMFREIVTHTNNYAVFKRDETRAQKNEPDYVDNMWVNTSVDEMRAFFGMNVIMGINNLPGYKLYWHKDSFLGNAGTGGSRLSRTVVKPDSCLARIFCIISFLYNLINLMQISTDKPDN